MITTTEFSQFTQISMMLVFLVMPGDHHREIHGGQKREHQRLDGAGQERQKDEGQMQRESDWGMQETGRGNTQTDKRGEENVLAGDIPK